MENDQPILSLCIPTYGIVDWVMPLVESIYSQNCPENKFEVIITDNGKTEDLEKALQKVQHANLHYYHTTASGYTNQIEAFKRGNGLFCKMINHRSRLLLGSIQKMIDLVERYKDTRPILYFLDKQWPSDKLVECENLDSFCRTVSYWSSWSGGVGIWKEDVNKIRPENINQMYPHAVLLFYIRQQSRYVVWNEQFDIQASDKGKGGYNVFEIFAVNYLNMMHKLLDEKRLKPSSFEQIRKDMMSFFRELYLNEVILRRFSIHTFIVDGALKHLSVYYTPGEVRRMVCWCYLKAVKELPRKIIKSIIRK